jgi:hypothetical protein
MVHDEEILFGKIALDLGYLDSHQLAECLAEQDTTPPPHLLGTIMLRRGLIDRNRLRELLEIQKQLRNKPAVAPDERQSDIRFGYLAIENGFMSQKEVIESVKEQTRLARNQHLFFRLGEVCVHLGHLEKRQVDEILEFQQHGITRCHVCHQAADVKNISSGKTFSCPTCENPMRVPNRVPSAL